jgi:hypothetical protein
MSQQQQRRSPDMAKLEDELRKPPHTPHLVEQPRVSEFAPRQEKSALPPVELGPSALEIVNGVEQRLNDMFGYGTQQIAAVRAECDRAETFLDAQRKKAIDAFTDFVQAIERIKQGADTNRQALSALMEKADKIA